MTLEYLFFLFERHSPSFCYQCIYQIQNVNSHLLVLVACFKCHISSFFMTACFLFTKKSQPEISCFQKWNKIKICVKTVQQFQSIEQKKKKKKPFCENIDKLFKKCILLYSPLMCIFKQGLPIYHTAAIFVSPRSECSMAWLASGL